MQKIEAAKQKWRSSSFSNWRITEGPVEKRTALPEPEIARVLDYEGDQGLREEKDELDHDFNKGGQHSSFRAT